MPSGSIMLLHIAQFHSFLWLSNIPLCVCVCACISSYLYIPHLLLGFPGSTDGKESACNAGDLASMSGSGRSLGEGNGNPLQYPCLEKSMDREAWQLQSVGSQRVRYDWVTNTFTFLQVGIIFPSLLFQWLFLFLLNTLKFLSFSHTHPCLCLILMTPSAPTFSEALWRNHLQFFQSLLLFSFLLPIHIYRQHPCSYTVIQVCRFLCHLRFSSGWRDPPVTAQQEKN